MKFRLRNHDAGNGGGAGTGAGENSNGQGGTNSGNAGAGNTNIAGSQTGTDNRLKPGDAGYDDELARARSEAAESRRKLREIEQANEQAEADRKKAAGQFESLYNDAAARLKGLEAIESENATLKQELKVLQDGRRAELIERLPEAQREIYKADGITIAEIERAVKLAGTAAPTNRNSTGSEAAALNATKEAGAMTAEELLALKQSDPAAYQSALLNRSSGPRGLWG